jgi:acid phosphatase family membrane protein YuiD
MALPDVSAYFIAAGLAFVLAQTIKYLINSRAKDSSGWRQLYMSGRMPSGHTATMVALTTVVAVRDGVESGLFAVTAVIALITAYDAMMSRRSAGEQGLALRKLLEKSPFSKDPMPYIALGHKPLEVAAGALLGVMIGFSVAFLITK